MAEGKTPVDFMDPVSLGPEGCDPNHQLNEHVVFKNRTVFQRVKLLGWL